MKSKEELMLKKNILLSHIKHLNNRIECYEIYKLQNLGYLNTNNNDYDSMINIFKSKIKHAEKALGELK